MNFLENDEFIILMSHNKYRTEDRGDNYHVYDVGERLLLMEAGIKTSHEQPAWNILEPAKREYNSIYLDDIIRTNQEAGMKSLIQISGWRNPSWMPNEWFCKTKDGNIERECLSFWNKEAEEYSDKFYRTMIDAYINEKDVRFFFGEFQGGEGALRPTWCIYDADAIQDYKRMYGSNAMPIPDHPETLYWLGKSIMEHYIRKARIFYEAYGEIWNCQQKLMDNWSRAFGNFVQFDTLQAFKQLWPDIKIYLLQYTYFDGSHGQDNVEFVDRIKNELGAEVIVEAMFASGLPTTAPRSIAKGFRGQILHPTMQSFSGEGLNQTILQNIKNAQTQWMESRGL